MNTMTITNETLYELLKDFKEDMHSFKRDVNNRFERIEKQQSEDHRILMDLWENRDRQKLNFSSIYFIITLLSATAVATITSYMVLLSN